MGVRYLFQILTALGTGLVGSGLLLPSAHADTFNAGSYVLPSDTNYQDQGGLLVYGLVYDLLLNDVPVRWAIQSGKAKDGVDFSATTAPLGGGAPSLKSYAGGPFVVDAGDASAALPIISSFQAANPTVTVHEATVSFTADVNRTMVAAPAIAVAVDGEEDVVFDYLNAAGIPDSAGQAWPNGTDGSGVYAGYPDIFTPAELAGTLGSPNDGALFTSNGLPRYGEVDFMHTDASILVPGLAAELRSFLTGQLNHIFLECKSIQSMEDNTAASFLTTLGIQDGGSPGPSSSLEYNYQDLVIAQHHGAFDNDGGSVRSVELDPGSAYDPNVSVLVKGGGEPDGEEDVLVFGPLDGDSSNGWVTFLGGHDYGTNLPISSNPKTNGARFYLNGLFITDQALAWAQPAWTLTTSGPSSTLLGTVTFTITWSTGPTGQSLSAALENLIPPGAVFVSASGASTYDVSTGVVTWPLGAVAPSSSGLETVTVTLPAPGSYVNTVTANYLAGLTPKSVTAVSSTTVLDVDLDGDGSGSLVDCDDGDASTYPGAPELCDGVDNDCDGVVPANEVDGDNDGQTGCDGDCDDTDVNTYLGATEICDGIDNDCDGSTPATEADGDGDGQAVCAGDCDDSLATTYLGAPELCNGVDDDCDGVVPANETDDDGDGQTECDGDCDDALATVYLGAPELCNGLDDDCDAVVPSNETDDDGDGQAECDGDCDDTSSSTYLGALEVCNGTDDDCDSIVDEGYDLDGIGGPDCTDADGDGQTEDQGDCDDSDNTVFTGAPELCDGIDNDCDGLTETAIDLDGDGVTPCDGDCDDTDPAVFPGAPEVCGNGLDDNCDGFADDNSDADGDGVMVCAGDCDDTDATVYVGAPELCDGLDNDCDGVVDEGDDLDGDGFSVCQGDCDDLAPTAYPGSAEDCTDGIDNDCDGLVDESEDLDGDGVTSCAGDCDDSDVAIYPGAVEVCDGLDNNCDGLIDEGLDADGDGVTTCGGDCDDFEPLAFPGATEDCTDGIDNDCDGVVDEDDDEDGDGYGTCLGLDCDDTDALVNPGAAEVCDGIDNDCDGVIDEGCFGDDDDSAGDDDDDDDSVGDDDDDSVGDDDDDSVGDDDDDDDDDDSGGDDDDDDDSVGDDDDDTVGDDDDDDDDDDSAEEDDAIGVWTESFLGGSGCTCSEVGREGTPVAWLLVLSLPLLALRRRRSIP